MSIIDFPNSPTVDDLFRVGDVTWRWNGTQWVGAYLPFSPDQIGGLRLWLDASDANTMTLASGAISEWRSKDANARAFTQATPASRPTYGGTFQNGRQVAVFTSQWLVSTAAASVWKFLHDGAKHTLFLVVKAGLVANPDARYDVISTGTVGAATISYTVLYDDRSAFSRDDAMALRVYNGTDVVAAATTPNSSVPANTFVLIRVDGDVGNGITADRGAIAVNGGTPTAVDVGTGTPSSSDPMSTLHIGVNGDGVSFPLRGGIAEALIYEGELTAAQVAWSEQRLAAKWGITLA